MKKKALTFVEIAVVLCSMFLVALPTTTIAAGQDDYVLDIYGNANEDDTIDMRDLTYVKLIFFGKKPETELADAKYDGEINPLDFIQIKLIIVGKEKELTVIDSADRIVTVKKPIKRLVVTFRQALELIRTVDMEADRIVGVESLVQSSGTPPWGINYKIFFPEFSDLPTVGGIWNPDIEAILNLHPDVVLLVAVDCCGSTHDKNRAVLESAGIAVLRVYGCVYGKAIPEEAKKFGYIFDKRKEAEEFINWYESSLNSIKEKVENIPEEDKTKVYFEGADSYNTFSEECTMIESAGGKSIFDIEHSGSVDPEAVAVRDPDVIVKVASWGAGGYHVDADETVDFKEAREEIMSRLELQKVKAVKDGRVYTISGYILCFHAGSGCRGFLQNLYMAKWFHPELFEDLDPKAIHQEYLTRFHRLDIDLDEKGVFVYHPEEHPHGS